jgi:hypothetical protein
MKSVNDSRSPGHSAGEYALVDSKRSYLMPKKKYSLTLREVQVPIRGLVTKFGGQPVRFTEAQWPLSRKFGTPMQFMGQIQLVPELFGPLEAQMAYLFFMTDAYMEEAVLTHGHPDTFDPDAGENAVILQPGIYRGPILPLTDGPTLYHVFPDERGLYVIKRPCEYAVEWHPGEDADNLASPWPDMTEEELSEEDDDLDDEAWMLKHRTHPSAWDLRYEASDENKIGGFPVPTTNHDTFPYPAGGPWQLLLQLQEVGMPFEINFGSDGTGYELLSEDGQVGKFLWMR